jgi:hypothetical protein
VLPAAPIIGAAAVHEVLAEWRRTLQRDGTTPAGDPAQRHEELSRP